MGQVTVTGLSEEETITLKCLYWWAAPDSEVQRNSYIPDLQAPLLAHLDECPECQVLHQAVKDEAAFYKEDAARLEREIADLMERNTEFRDRMTKGEITLAKRSEIAEMPTCLINNGTLTEQIEANEDLERKILYGFKVLVILNRHLSALRST